MKCFLHILFLPQLLIGSVIGSLNKTSLESGKEPRALNVFNVVSFPNSACGAKTGYNGTCYTTSECLALGGVASGSCASSFGVCCVFSISCGGSTSANNSYAIMSSYAVSSDADPCTYKFCRTTSSVCKLRIDFDKMVLEGPFAISSTAAATDGPRVGDCGYDSLTVTNPGGAAPPVICGYNSGQHMFVPASTTCNSINIDIDTGKTSTTRSWQIKVTQYECGDMMAPDQDCLQYHASSSGSIATYNWDTSSTTVSSSQYHLSTQSYDICIRRARGFCSICFSPYISSSITGIASSYGVGGSGLAPAQTGAVGVTCTGITTQPAAAGYGDYLEIANLQPSIGTAGSVVTGTRICGAIFNAGASPQTAQATACSFVTPFKVGVHFDEEESIHASPFATPDLNKAENDPAATSGAGFGYSGFWLHYWQNSC